MLIQKQYNKLIFKGNLARNPVANKTMLFIIRKAKETVLDFQFTLIIFKMINVTL